MSLNWLIGKFHHLLYMMKLQWRKRMWPKAAPRSLPLNPRFIVSGFMGEILGIGRAAELTCAALRSVGFEVTEQALRPLHMGLLRKRPDPFTQGRTANLWLVHANPLEAELAMFALAPAVWRDLYRIGYWAWESSLAPPKYVQMADYFHEIWVPSHFVKSALLAAFDAANRPDLIAKVKIMPHPVRPLKPVQKSEDMLTVLTLFDPKSDFERKNPEGALKAWLQAFPEARAKTRLIIKSHALAASTPLIRHWQETIGARSDIDLMCEDLSAQDNEALLSRADILISLHRAEGFGLSLAEAMSAGVCVVATGASGNADFMNPSNSCPVRSKPVPANRPYNGPHGLWFEPDTDQAAQLLLELVNNADQRHRLAAQARLIIDPLWQPWLALKGIAKSV